MKTQTTLAALLLAAVMVTPSYGASEAFLVGSSDLLKDKTNWNEGFFSGYCYSIYHRGYVKLPKGSKTSQLYTVVARYVSLHPEEHHLPADELVKRACTEAWPHLNNHINWRYKE